MNAGWLGVIGGKIMCKNDKIDELYIKLGQYKQIVDRLTKLCRDNRNINGLLDLESFHGEVQKILVEDVVDCPMHHLPAIPDKNMIYQCKKCVEETRERT